MFSSNLHDQTILDISQGDYIAITAESFLIDRQAGGLSHKTIKFYRQYLKSFIEHSDSHSLKHISDVTSNFLRRYLLTHTETHNLGGVHGAFRILRAFFQWIINEEIMPPEWKNPIFKVKPPKVSVDPLVPISIQEVKSLIDVS